jgi:hypothetical protein
MIMMGSIKDFGHSIAVLGVADLLLWHLNILQLVLRSNGVTYLGACQEKT